MCVYLCVFVCVWGGGWGGGQLKFRWMAVYTTSYLAANGAMAFMHPKIMMNSGTGRRLMASPLSSLERPPAKNLQHSQVKTKYAKKKRNQHGFWAHGCAQHVTSINIWCLY